MGFYKNIMKIFFTPNTNFQAKFIRKEPIKILADDGLNYKPASVSFVEIETDKADDIAALLDRAKKWGKESYFSQDIADNAESMHKEKIKNSATKFYVATLQNDKFEKLEPKNIQGMVEIKKIKPYHIEIMCLQAGPEALYTGQKTTYKNIGRSIIRALKAQKENKVISLMSMFSSANFYEKMGFEIVDTNKLLYVWKRFKPKH